MMQKSYYSAKPHQTTCKKHEIQSPCEEIESSCCITLIFEIYLKCHYFHFLSCKESYKLLGNGVPTQNMYDTRHINANPPQLYTSDAVIASCYLTDMSGLKRCNSGWLAASRHC